MNSLCPSAVVGHEGACLPAKSLSRVPLSATPWTVAHQAPLSMGFSRQESWSGCCALLQGVLPTQGSSLRLLSLLHCRQALYHQRCPGSPWAVAGGEGGGCRFGCELSSDQSPKEKLATSLMVQRLRFLAPNAGAWVPSLAGELDPTCYN